MEVVSKLLQNDHGLLEKVAVVQPTMVIGEDDTAVDFTLSLEDGALSCEELDDDRYGGEDSTPASSIERESSSSSSSSSASSSAATASLSLSAVSSSLPKQRRSSRRRRRKANAKRQHERAYVGRNKPKRNAAQVLAQQGPLPPLDYLDEGELLCRSIDDRSLEGSLGSLDGSLEGGSVTEGSLDGDGSLEELAQLEKDLFLPRNDEAMRLFVPPMRRARDILGTLPAFVQDAVLDFLAPPAQAVGDAFPSSGRNRHHRGALLVQLLDAGCLCGGLKHPCAQCARSARSAWAFAESAASHDAAVVRAAQHVGTSIRAVCRAWAELWGRDASERPASTSGGGGGGGGSGGTTTTTTTTTSSSSRGEWYHEDRGKIDRGSRSSCGMSLADRVWSRVSMRALKQWVASKDLVQRIVELHGQRITCVDLSGVKSLSDESVRSVLEFCVRLRSLSVRKTRVRGSGAAWHWLSPEQTGRPSTLTALNLSHCTALRDGIVEVVARSCAALLSLELAGCKRLTDASLRALSAQGASEDNPEEEEAATHRPQLTALDVGNATAITAEAAGALLEHQRELLVLNLGGCRIEDASMVQLARRHPHCRIYRR